MHVTPRLSDEQEEIVYRVIGAAIGVHKELGPGFKERIYEQALCLELDSRSIAFERQEPILVKYKSWEIPGQRIDLIVAGMLLIELKAVPRLKAIHEAQVLSYLKTTGLPLGLLMNFNSRRLKDSLKRIAL